MAERRSLRPIGLRGVGAGALAALLVVGIGPCETPCTDANGDGIVDILDISLVSSCQGEDPTTNPTCEAADVNGDGAIDGQDLAAVIADFGALARLEGELRAVDPASELDPTAGELLGSFELASPAGEDLRSVPGTATLVTPDGTLTAEATRVNELRNVDPLTGIPRRELRQGPCTTPAFVPNPAFDPSFPFDPLEPFFIPGDTRQQIACWPGTPAVPRSVNPGVFDAQCLLTEGAIGQDTSRCVLDLFRSRNNSFTGSPSVDPETQPILSALLANQLAGSPAAWAVSQSAPGGLAPPSRYPSAGLFVDPCDGFLSDCVTEGPGFATPGPTSQTFFSALPPNLNASTTVQQQALVGCGEFWGLDCERDGIRLLDTELSVLTQSWGSEDSFDASTPQPGTLAFVGRPVAAREVEGEPMILPGARGPLDAGYDVLVDGSSAVLLHPTAGWLNAGPNGLIEFGGDDVYDPTRPRQQFENELAALSFNALFVLVGQSLPPSRTILPNTNVDRAPVADEFSNGVGVTADNGDVIPADLFAGNLDLSRSIFRTDGCSLRSPMLCRNVRWVREATLMELASDPSGPPSRRWRWESGAEYAPTEATGSLEGFDGWPLHALGPEEPRTPSSDVIAVPILLEPPPGATPPAGSPFLQFAPGRDGILGTPDDAFVGYVFGNEQRP